MDYVVVRTHVINHERLLEAGALARDLWSWGMLYAGQHETDGELPMVAVLASPWGYGSKRNVVLADKLVAVGLWERSDRGYRVSRWAEQGNKTRAQIDEARAAARERMSKRRLGRLPALSCSEEVRANAQRTSHDVPASASASSDQEIQKTRSTPPPSGPPDWWPGLVERVCGDTGETFGAAEAWLAYSGHRAGKGIAVNDRDAGYWLARVMVPQAREERKRDAARGKKFEPPEPAPKSKEQQEREAKELVARVIAGRKTGT